MTASRVPEEKIETGALQDAIFNSANFSSIATDEKGVIQIFNVGAERMLGYAAADVVDKITPADISDPQELITRAEELSLELGTAITPGFEALVFKASRGIEDIYELTYVRKDGSRFPAIVSVTSLRDEQEAIIGYLLIGTDNTAGKKVEADQASLDQRLRDQQFYTRSLIESNIDALMTTDPRGVISDVNQEMVNLTGRTRDELIGAPCRNFFTDPLRADSAIKRVLTEGKVSDYELTIRAQNGTETVVSYNAATFQDRDRKLQGVFAAARDVTERIQAEQERESAREEADRANRAKSEFLSRMSHELRTPLNAILGFAQLLELDHLTPEQREGTGEILKAGKHLLELIDEVLDISRIEAGRLRLSLEPVDAVHAVEECISLLRPQAEQEAVTLTLEPQGAPERSAYVTADRQRLKQVLLNLISNGIKYNRQHGSVRISIDQTEQGRRISIDVTDTGRGIPAEQMEQLFAPFERLAAKGSSIEGTGLGLALSRPLVEAMGGTISVTSEPGTGSTFSVELAAADDAGVLPEDPDRSQEDFAATFATSTPRTILYIEDNLSNLKLVERVISRRQGYVLMSAMQGGIGVTLARDHLPDLILLDLDLPDIRGEEVLGRLRSDPRTATLPVVVISAEATSDQRSRLMGAGARDFISKPISIDRLLRIVDEHCADDQAPRNGSPPVGSGTDTPRSDAVDETTVRSTCDRGAVSSA